MGVIDQPGTAEAIPHGGDLAAAARAHPRAPKPWIDLSTGINPRAWPTRAVPRAAFARLPAPADLVALENAAAAAYGATGAAIASAGTHPLVAALARDTAGKRVAVLSPTYGEHAPAFARAGARVETPRDLDGLRGADLAVVVNPNNPDGALRDAAALRALARDVGLLLVDEAFVDFLPAGASLAGAVPDNAVVLRSFGKAHGLAGLRLAFAICAPVRAAALRAEIGPWPVSGLAIAIGVTALADRDWRDRARRLALAGAERLDRLLTRSGLIARGAAPLFRYLETPRAAALHRALAEAGIWTRAFAGRPDALRIGLPFGAAAWSRLERALTAFEG